MLKKLFLQNNYFLSRWFSTQSHYKLVIVGGGSGGCSLAAKFKYYGNDVCVVEPSKKHYYQPLWTLVGSGIKDIKDSFNDTASVLPKQVTWLEDRVENLVPQENTVVLSNGKKIYYDFLIVALGIKIEFEKIAGLKEALKSDCRVCSNYSIDTVGRTFKAFELAVANGRPSSELKSAIFTFPNCPIKCAGAPQKIMYLFEDFVKRKGQKDKFNIQYFIGLPLLFSSKHYADKLWQVCKERNISVTLNTYLSSVDAESSTAIFKNTQAEKTLSVKYDFMHVTPPMGPHDFLKGNDLANDAGYITVDQATLQHKKYPNVFGIGDCVDVPTSKTAAAVAGQAGVVSHNLLAVMSGKKDQASFRLYNGYTSCPLVTAYDKCILAEFDYTTQPLETLPWNQNKESRISFLLKVYALPFIYWNLFLRGYWNGPGSVRKALSFLRPLFRLFK